MNEATGQLLKKAVLDGAEGVIICGTIAEVRSVSAGIDRTTNQPYDAYTSCRVVTGLGQSATVKLPNGIGVPKALDKCAFVCSRVWRGQGGVSAQAEFFL